MKRKYVYALAATAASDLYGTRARFDGGGRIHADLPFLMVMPIAPSWEAA